MTPANDRKNYSVYLEPGIVERWDAWCRGRGLQKQHAVGNAFELVMLLPDWAVGELMATGPDRLVRGICAAEIIARASEAVTDSPDSADRKAEALDRAAAALRQAEASDPPGCRQDRRTRRQAATD